MKKLMYVAAILIWSVMVFMVSYNMSGSKSVPYNNEPVTGIVKTIDVEEARKSSAYIKTTDGFKAWIKIPGEGERVFTDLVGRDVKFQKMDSNVVSGIVYSMSAFKKQLTK